jgi:hypothetical protein
VSELPALARRARALLADALDATLLIHEVGRLSAGGPSVVLHDRDGLPTFFCDPGSVVARAAHRRRYAILTVSDSAGGGAESVMLGGSLAHIGVEWVDGVGVDIVTLTPELVTLQRSVPDRVPWPQIEVPVELFLAEDRRPVRA